MRFQLSAGSTVFCFLILGLAAFGAAASIAQKRRGAWLCPIYIAVPWMIFLAGETRENTLHSLYRYLMFLLPPIFLLAARGAVVAGAGLGSVFFPGKRARGAVLSKAITGILVAAVTVGGFNAIRWYSTDYWRQGSFELGRAARALLNGRAARDAMLYLDVFPVSSATIMLDPLAKDLKPEEIEFVVREDYEAAGTRHKAMIYSLGWSYFEGNAASRKIELWALIPGTESKLSFLRTEAEKSSGIEVFDLDGRVLLHFPKSEESLAQKMARLADLLLALPESDPVIRRQRWLLAAKAFFMTREADDGIRAVDAFRAIPVGPGGSSERKESWLDRVLGFLWGLDSDRLRTICERRSLGEVRHVALGHANNLVSAGRLDAAFRAYKAVLTLGDACDSRVLDRLLLLSERYQQAGRISDAAEVCREGLRCDPARPDFSKRLAALDKILDSAPGSKRRAGISPF